MSQEHYKWDRFSDQPYTIADKNYKKQVRLRAVPAMLKMGLLTLLLMPFVSLKYFFSKVFCLPIQTKNMIGLCINEDKCPEQTLAFVKDLGVTTLSVRIPMSDVDDLQKYFDFISQFSSCEILFVILQDRQHIEDHALCEQSLTKIFTLFSPLSKKFQIGNAINRTKWGFDSVDEYLGFYKLAYTLNKSQSLGLTLFGSSVIDFEFYAIVRSLFNFYSFSYGGLSSLLYVDRRGAPENKQLNFDLPKKILLIKSIAALSSKVGKRLIISETNWAIEETQPYAPALDDVWVSEELYANYLCRYYLLAMSTGSVETIYWHQLFSPGYGLIDNLDGQCKQRRGYFYFRTLLRFFSDVTINAISIDGDRYCVKARDKQGREVKALWITKGEAVLAIGDKVSAFSALGEPLPDSEIKLSESVVYLLG